MIELPAFVTTCPIPRPPVGWFDYGYAVLLDGTLALVRVDRDFTAADQRTRWLEWPEQRLRLSGFDGHNEGAATEVPALRWPNVERLPDGRWVIVASRARDEEKNAQLFTGNGDLVGEFVVGDAVEHVACSPDGRIWVGYFDEGTGAKANPDGSWPPACSGLAAFGPDGHCRWRFELEGHWIADCYALGTSESDVWACTYDDFPILLIRDGKVQAWMNDVIGAHAITAASGHIILAGGYEEEAERVVLLRLDGLKAVPITRMRLPGITLNGPLLQGRDGVMHAVVADQWLRVSIADWLSAL